MRKMMIVMGHMSYFLSSVSKTVGKLYRELCNGLESYFHVRTDVSFVVDAQYPTVSQRGVTIEDPDGWRVILMNTNGI
jgi:hypothetical protein